MNPIVLSMLFIFFARVCDVSLGTVRIILITRGNKVFASLIGFFEILIWLFAISTALKNMEGFWSYVSYAGGFATGNFVGMFIGEKIKTGFQSIRIITSKTATRLHDLLRGAGIIINTVIGTGSEGEVSIIFTVVSRKQVKAVLALVEQNHPKAFITIEDVKSYHEGFMSQSSPWDQIARVFNKKK